MANTEAQKTLQVLKEAGTESPDLGEYYALQASLVQELARAKADISLDKLEIVESATLQAKLRQGFPLLSFDQLPLETEQFTKLVSTAARILIESYPSPEGQTMPGGSAECLTLARQRFEEGQAFDAQANTDLDEGGGEPSLAQTSVDLALRPYLEWAAERLLPLVEDVHWRRNYCPVCGGAPDLAFLDEESGGRYLVCSRCTSQWAYRRVGCPFCGINDHTKLSYYLGEDESYRLYVCQACHRYLKVLDLRRIGRQVLFTAERITTVGMDLAARQAGYK